MGRGCLLAGRVAVVTGGGGEIGSAIVRRFAAEGAAVLVADLRLENASALAEEIVGGGSHAAAVACDITRAEDAENVVGEAVRRFGKLTTLINMAATLTPAGAVETLTLENWKKTLDVNLTGAFLMCKYAVPAIKKAGGGTIVSIASSHGHVGVPKRAPYCTSKAALIQFMKCVAIDHAEDKNPGEHDLAGGDRHQARHPATLPEPRGRQSGKGTELSGQPHRTTGGDRGGRVVPVLGRTPRS